MENARFVNKNIQIDNDYIELLFTSKIVLIALCIFVFSTLANSQKVKKDNPNIKNWSNEISEVLEDCCEPDNTFGTVGLQSVDGQGHKHKISPEDDLDYAKFILTAPSYVVIETSFGTDTCIQYEDYYQLYPTEGIRFYYFFAPGKGWVRLDIFSKTNSGRQYLLNRIELTKAILQ